MKNVFLSIIIQVIYIEFIISQKTEENKIFKESNKRIISEKLNIAESDTYFSSLNSIKKLLHFRKWKYIHF